MRGASYARMCIFVTYDESVEPSGNGSITDERAHSAAARL